MQKIRDIVTWMIRRLTDQAAAAMRLSDDALTGQAKASLVLRELIIGGGADGVLREACGAIASEVNRLGTLALRGESEGG